MTDYGMVIDQERCIGCHACAVTCKQENNVPMGQYWNRILTEGGEHLDTPEGGYPEPGEGSSLDMAFQPTACQHCSNAPCVKVCPVNATYTRDDGIVEIDYDKCIGCRYCMAACPYNARVFNWGEPEHRPESGTGDIEARPRGTVEKCTFCTHRVEEGLDPACVVNCPADARIFGDFDDETSTVSEYVNDYDTHQLLDDLGTDPNTYYVKGEMTPGRPQKGEKLESEYDLDREDTTGTSAETANATETETSAEPANTTGTSTGTETANATETGTESAPAANTSATDGTETNTSKSLADPVPRVPTVDGRTS